MSQYEIEPYDPCPCGSGKKYKFCCAEKAKANRHGKFPVGTTALYGPDDKTTIKIVAAVILREGDEPILKRWIGAEVAADPKVLVEIKQFFARYGVKNVVAGAENIGCPHEEGIDFPRGGDCPDCPFWAGKQGTARLGFSLDDGACEEDYLEEEAYESEDEDDEDDDHFISGDEADEIFARVAAILGNVEDETFDRAVEKLCERLKTNLQLPCEVTGIEDFRWEEPYVLGGWSPSEYRRLKKSQPSYRDKFELLAIETGEESEWMMFGGDDIAAHVRRKSDGKEFVLGLAELEGDR